MLGVAEIYLPNEKIVGLDQQRTQHFLSDFLHVSRGFGLRVFFFWRNSFYSFLIQGGG